jgi:RimJ/RimL family protein N-acetyltransferase
MNSYKALNKQKYAKENFVIVPIRFEDRFSILNWRNEQMYHLRQQKTLTEENQETYFKNVVQVLFNQENPNQLLFSYLENGICIGYGGLVHINWIDKNAEISFIMNTSLEQHYFAKHWTIFLELIEKVAFQDINLHKISTFAFDLRPHLYPIIEKAGFEKEATLQQHCFFNGIFIDVIIHRKLNKNTINNS